MGGVQLVGHRAYQYNSWNTLQCIHNGLNNIIVSMLHYSDIGIHMGPTLQSPCQTILLHIC